MSPAKLVEKVAAAGYAFEVSDAGSRLVPVLTGAVMPPALLEEVRVNRGELLVYLNAPRESESDPEGESTTCSACDRTLFAVDPARMSDPAFCDQGGAKPVRNPRGEVTAVAVRRCPYKH